MSRSRKKEPIVKNKGDQEYNKRIRRVCKQMRVDEATIYPLSNEITNQYDICDWKCDARDFGKIEKLKKFKRK